MLGKKLELQWANKGKSLYFDLSSGKYEWVDKKDPLVSEPRILIEKESIGDLDTENILIKGDNLLALKALLPDYRNKIKLIYIDPPCKSLDGLNCLYKVYGMGEDGLGYRYFTGQKRAK